MTRFYYPLALTTLLSLGIHPVVTFFVGNSRMSLESLAVLPVIGSLVFIFRSVGLAYQEVVIALIGDEQEGYVPLRTFGIFGLSLGVAVGLSLIAWTPLAGVWFRDVSGLTDELAAFALTPTRILAVIPGLTALLSFQRAVMVIRTTTNRITWATIIEVVGVGDRHVDRDLGSRRRRRGRRSSSAAHRSHRRECVPRTRDEGERE